MRRVLEDLPDVHIYCNDILCTSSTIEDHFLLLQTVLDRLKSAGLKIAPDKCRFFQTSFTYLWHHVTPDGISIDPDRVKVINKMSRPTSIKEAKRVLGFS